MIQSTTSMPAAVNSMTTETVQPAAARSVSAKPAGDAARGFGERMRSAAVSAAAQPVEQSVVSLRGGVSAAVTEPAVVSFDDEAAAESAEPGLLEIIERQLAEIEAREAAQANAVPELLAQQPPAPEIDRLDEQLGWLSNLQPSLPDAPSTRASAERLEAVPASGRQGSFLEANPLASARFGELGTAMRAPTDMPAGSAQPLPMAVQAVDAPSALEPLLADAEPLEAGDPLTTTERGQAAPSPALDRSLKLQAPEAKWGEQMLHSLRENVELQIKQKIQSATIRLDPPELGSLEILLSHESGRLNVQLSAVNADVARLLQQTSDRLRQELVGQHFVQVNVQVGADGGGRQGQPRQPMPTAEELPIAARPHDQEESRASEHARDVLVTV